MYCKKEGTKRFEMIARSGTNVRGLDKYAEWLEKVD